MFFPERWLFDQAAIRSTEDNRSRLTPPIKMDTFLKKVGYCRRRREGIRTRTTRKAFCCSSCTSAECPTERTEPLVKRSVRREHHAARGLHNEDGGRLSSRESARQKVRICIQLFGILSQIESPRFAGIGHTSSRHLAMVTISITIVRLMQRGRTARLCPLRRTSSFSRC